MSVTNLPGHNDRHNAQSATHHGNEASDELEILEVVRVDVGGGVNLETVVIFAGIFKQAVHGVQNFMGQQEEPLPAREESRVIRKGQTQTRPSFIKISK